MHHIILNWSKPEVEGLNERHFVLDGVTNFVFKYFLSREQLRIYGKP